MSTVGGEVRDREVTPEFEARKASGRALLTHVQRGSVFGNLQVTWDGYVTAEDSGEVMEARL